MTNADDRICPFCGDTFSHSQTHDFLPCLDKALERMEIAENSYLEVGPLLKRANERRAGDHTAIAAFRARAEKAESDFGKLVCFVKQVSSWRRDCYAHDRDMGYPLRDFNDVEEWKMIERLALELLKSVNGVKP